MDVSLPIENKNRIEEIIAFSSEIPADVLRVVPGTVFDGLEGRVVTVALVARCPVDQDYMIGHKNLKVVIADTDQEAPMVTGDPMLSREKNDFRDNDAYASYVIYIAEPCVTRPWQKYRTMAPCATPHRM